MSQLKILVTGSAGAVGYRIALGLRNRGHILRGFDLRPQRLAGEHCIANLLDLEALRRAAKGVDVIVHVAAIPDRQDFAQMLVPSNIVGTHHVMEVARLEGIQRVVNSSSVRVVGGLSWKTGQIGLDAGFVPDDHYGISKATGELLGEMYARRFGISVVSARLGWFVRNQQEARDLRSYAEGPRIYLSHNDAQDFYIRAVETPSAGSVTVYVTSHNGGNSAFDLGPAERIFGYQPKDTFPEGSVWSDTEDFPSPQRAASLNPERTNQP